ncbi:hypothetical protein NFI96_031303, partial [Prochilodus magdalenae]
SVMKSCSSALCVLILLITTFTPGWWMFLTVSSDNKVVKSALRTLSVSVYVVFSLSVSESAAPTVTVELHDSATLPCPKRCSGVVRWTMFHKPTEVLAECNQTSCRSVKEGYQMIHDQYLKGDLSLTITDADLRKRSLYTSTCDGKELCDVQLKIEAVNRTVQIPPGEAIVLKVDSPDPVEVTYMSTAGPSSGQTDPRTLCSVKNHKLRCYEGYEDRVSLTSVLELRGLTQSDSGVYTVRDRETKEALYIYRVTVESTHRSGLQDDQTDPGPAGPGRMTVLLGVLLGVSVCVIVGLVVVVVRQRRGNQRMRNERNNTEMNELGNPGEAQRLSSPTTNQEP